MILSVEDSGYNACSVGFYIVNMSIKDRLRINELLTSTLQLIWLDAQTFGEVLQTRVLFCPSSSPVKDESELSNEFAALWQAEAVWQTLQPVPVHPLWQEHPDEVRLANPPDEVDVKGLCEPSKMFPPQANSEQVEPPVPVGHSQLVPLSWPKFSQVWEWTLDAEKNITAKNNIVVENMAIHWKWWDKARAPAKLLLLVCFRRPFCLHSALFCRHWWLRGFVQSQPVTSGKSP